MTLPWILNLLDAGGAPSLPSAATVPELGIGTLFASADRLRFEGRDSLVQSDETFGTVHTGRYAVAIPGAWVAEWDSAPIYVAHALADHYATAPATPFRMRRYLADDRAPVVTWFEPPAWTPLAGGKFAQLKAKVRALDGAVADVFSEV